MSFVLNRVCIFSFFFFSCSINRFRVFQVFRFFFLVYYCFSASWNGQDATSKSFIFSLVDKEGLAPFKSMVKLSQSSFAIYSRSYLGPAFGCHWGCDLLINSNANQRLSSYTDFGTSYSLPNGVTDRRTILAGTYNFSPDEVEVFYFAWVPLSFYPQARRNHQNSKKNYTPKKSL